MATLDQLKQALINADKAGDTAAAQKLAAAIKQQQAAAPAQPAAPTSQPEQPGFLARAADVVTGNLRDTEQTQTLPSYYDMPEMNDIFSIAGWKTGLGTLFSSPEEAVQVIKANAPNVQVSQDEKGNYILVSAKDGKPYAIQPGIEPGDVVKMGASLAAFTPAGRATSILGAGAAAAGTQAAIEGTQAATGGTFNTADVVTSGVLGAAMPAVTNLVKNIRQPIAQATGQADTPIMMQGVDNVPPVAPKAPTAAPKAPTAAPKATAPTPAAQTTVATEVTREQFGEVANKAAKGGIGSQKAKEELARLAQINPEAKKAAEAVGIDLPIDLMSDSRLLTEQVALSRYIKGSPQSTEWKTFREAAGKRADEVIRSLDGGTPVSTISQNVKTSLEKTRRDLKTSAKGIYEEIDKAMTSGPIEATTTNTQQLLSKYERNYGGIENMPPEMRKLFDIATNPSTTYVGFDGYRKQVGKALRGAQQGNPFGNTDTFLLREIESAMKADQLADVARVLGDDAVNNLKFADKATAQRKAIERRIVQAFGKDGDKSIAPLIDSALSKAAKGDDSALNRAFAIIPKDMQKETIMTAILDRATTNQGNFAFGQFESMYNGLRSQPRIYADIESRIGKEASELLRSLYVVSKRINTAENAISKTGSDTAATLINQYAAQGLVGKILEGTVGRGAVSASPVIRKVPIVGADLAQAAVNAATTNKQESVIAASKFITSPDFAQLVEDVAKRGAEKAAQSRAVRKVAVSPQFATWANRAGLPRGIRVREEWIRSAILAAQQNNPEQK